MFTGIIESIGFISDIKPQTVDTKITINTGNLDLSDVNIGDSIAVNGVCLTVIQLESDGFLADVSLETLQRSCLGYLKQNAKVNLEKALMPTTRLGGHLVAGHIDDIGTIVAKKSAGISTIFGIKSPDGLKKYIAEKGSITVDGVSLTVNAINNSVFYLNIVPHTLAKTIADNYQIGTKVNLEIDLLARYLERIIQGDNITKPNAITQDFLQKHGFTC